MKNLQRGFIVPALLAAIAIIVIGGGVYVYESKKTNDSIATDVQVEQSNETQQQTNTSSWKKYSDAFLSFEYPSSISVKKEGENLTLSHSIAYKHPDACDFKGDAPPLERLSDFYVSLKIVNKNLKDLVQTSDYPGWDYVSANPFKSGSWNGYKVTTGIEGCGADVYYITISPTKTLVINRSLITELSPISGNYQTYLNLPGIISPTQAEEFFTKILSSLKVQQTNTQTPPVTIQPSIKVLSPSGGERVPAGSSFVIKWSSTNVSSRVSLTLHLSGIQQVIYLDSGDTSVSNNGSLTWRVPTTFDELNSTLVDRDYVAYITINDVQNRNIIAQSKNFTITRACTNNGSMGTYKCPTTTTAQPSISAVSGPTSLKAGEMGTWSVKINYPVVTRDKLSFYAVWGDEKTTPALPSYVGPNNASGADDAAKLYHTYDVPGIYNPTFTIIDNNNQTAQKSVNVSVVSNVSTVTPPASVVGTSQTVNGITVMKEGKLADFLMPQGNGYTLNTTNILNNFYSNHADIYDFLVVFSPKQSNSHWSHMLNQSGETLGLSFGSTDTAYKKVRSIVSVDISGPDSVAHSGVSVADFEQGNMRTTLTTLSHEIAHHWLAYIPWEGMKSVHYSNMVDLFSGSLSYADPMGYHHWVNTASGKVCVDNNSSSIIPKFSNLSLYLMGLVPKTSVQSIPVIQTSVNYAYGQPQCDETTNFLDTKTYTLDDILALAGKDRVPAYPNTQRDFKVGYIIVTPANENLSSAAMTFASDIMSQFPQYWSNLTNNLSRIMN